MKPAVSQTDLILAALQSGEKLTQGDALERFGCMRLPSRIDELHKRGIRTTVKMIKLPSGKRVAQYSLAD